jgi:hypothetical protein
VPGAEIQPRRGRGLLRRCTGEEGSIGCPSQRGTDGGAGTKGEVQADLGRAVRSAGFTRTGGSHKLSPRINGSPTDQDETSGREADLEETLQGPRLVGMRGTEAGSGRS